MRLERQLYSAFPPFDRVREKGSGFVRIDAGPATPGARFLKNSKHPFDPNPHDDV